MNNLSREDVDRVLEEFSRHIEEEKDLQEEITSLEVGFLGDMTPKVRQRHDELLEKIGKAREEKIFPLMNTLQNYVNQCQSEEED